MSVDAWKNWLRKWRNTPTRRVSLRRAGVQAESLEERALLGELVPASMPAEATEYAQVEVAVLSTSETAFDGASQASYTTSQNNTSTSGTDQSTPLREVDVEQSSPTSSSDSSSSPTEKSSTSIKGAKSASAKSELKASKAEQRAAAREARKAARAEAKKPQGSTSGNSTNTGSPGSAEPDLISGVGGVPSGSDSSASTGGNTTVPGLGLPQPTGSQPTGSTGSTGSTSTPNPISDASSPESLASVFMGDPQLSTTDVEQLLDRASAATPSQDAIIVVVDRQGIILGVRAEAAVPTADLATLVFSIDGALAKARTAAFFSNNQGVLTSRTVRFISQTTITQREVESNPSITDMNSTIAGPGFVAPIGLGGHFPPDIMHTPPVDLFAIEHTNRDSIDEYPGGEGRFHADYVSASQEINAPGSYGVQSGLMPDALPRGIATLPGGIPIYRDTNGNGIGDTVVGGIGVFFPGPDGYASYEQGFVQGANQSTTSRTNAELVEETEVIAFTAIGSAVQAGVKATDVGGVPPVPGIDLPFPRIDLVGITLEAIGPTAGIEGVRQIKQLAARLGQGVVNGTDQPVTPTATLQAGTAVPTGWLVAAHDGVGITAADVTKIINQGIAEANRVRAAIRAPLGTRTKMVFAVTDTTGEVLGLYRMDDATYFSLDVAVAKARNVSYYNDPTALQPQDRVIPKQNPAINPRGVAFTSRTFRFLAEPRYPSGVDGSKPGAFSILNEPSINPKNAENLGAPAPANTFQTAVGYDSFNIGTNFHDPSNPENQNGVVFFPGSSGIYKNGVLVGGLGVSGDGVDQDDVVTTAAINGFAAPTSIRADQYTYRNVRLPYNKFLRNPYG